MSLNKKEQGIYPRQTEDDYWLGPRDRLFWDWYWSF